MDPAPVPSRTNEGHLTYGTFPFARILYLNNGHLCTYIERQYAVENWLHYRHTAVLTIPALQQLLTYKVSYSSSHLRMTICLTYRLSLGILVRSACPFIHGSLKQSGHKTPFFFSFSLYPIMVAACCCILLSMNAD